MSQSDITHPIWVTLAFALFGALATGRWSLAFVALATLVLTFLPVLADGRVGISLPVRFVAAIALFAFATIFLGEAFDFYGRYWWWDIALHGGSAPASPSSWCTRMVRLACSATFASFGSQP